MSVLVQKLVQPGANQQVDRANLASVFKTVGARGEMIVTFEENEFQAMSMAYATRK